MLFYNIVLFKTLRSSLNYILIMRNFTKFLIHLLSFLMIHSAISKLSVRKNIVLYDGVCNFCNRWVDLLLKLDKRKKFTFSALQSEKGKDLLQAIGKQRNDISSVVFIRTLEDANDKSEVYFKSDAALKVMEELGLPLNLISYLLSILPIGLRNSFYDIVANNRYNLLGKREECRCSDQEANDRFLS